MFGDGLATGGWSVFRSLTRFNNFKSSLTVASGSVKLPEDADEAVTSFEDVLDFAAAVIASNCVTSAVIVKDWAANCVTSLISANFPYKLISAKISFD